MTCDHCLERDRETERQRERKKKAEWGKRFSPLF